MAFSSWTLGTARVRFFVDKDVPERLLGKMFFRLLLLFTCVPLVELYILLQVGSVIGAANTILLVILTGVLGAFLAQREGIRTLQTIQSVMARGEMPGEALLDALLILVAGFVLITPGILTDTLGFLLLIPATRLRIRVWVNRQVERKLTSVNTTVY
jgi:UPF0716 protein FxsA